MVILERCQSTQNIRSVASRGLIPAILVVMGDLGPKTQKRRDSSGVGEQLFDRFMAYGYIESDGQ